MNLHSKVRLTACRRAKIVHRILNLHQPVALIAATFDVSERTALRVLFVPQKNTHPLRAAKLSKASVARFMHRQRVRLAELSPPRPVVRYERELPGDLLYFNIKKLARILRPSHRVTGDRQHDHSRGADWEYLHIAIDDRSLIAFAQILPDKTTRIVIAFLLASIAFLKMPASLSSASIPTTTPPAAPTLSPPKSHASASSANSPL